MALRYLAGLPATSDTTRRSGHTLTGWLSGLSLKCLPTKCAQRHRDGTRTAGGKGERLCEAARTVARQHADVVAAGIIVRAPGTWQAGRPARPLVKASVGARAPSLLGTAALLDFSMEVSLDAERLSATETKALLSGGNGLQLIRGR